MMVRSGSNPPVAIRAIRAAGTMLLVAATTAVAAVFPFLFARRARPARVHVAERG